MKRIEVIKALGSKCEICETKDKLHIHHFKYMEENKSPIFKSIKYLLLLCCSCHKRLHQNKKDRYSEAESRSRYTHIPSWRFDLWSKQRKREFFRTSNQVIMRKLIREREHEIFMDWVKNERKTKV